MSVKLAPDPMTEPTWMKPLRMTSQNVPHSFTMNSQKPILRHFWMRILKWLPSSRFVRNAMHASIVASSQNVAMTSPRTCGMPPVAIVSNW